MSSHPDELLPHEAAARLHVVSSTVRRWDKAGWLVPSTVLPSGYRRYAPSDVDELAAVLQLPKPERERRLDELRARNLARAEERRLAALRARLAAEQNGPAPA